jgi:hypothetical protein
MPGSMLILTWVGIIFVIILHRAIVTNIMPTHVKISIEPGVVKLATHEN